MSAAIPSVSPAEAWATSLATVRVRYLERVDLPIAVDVLADWLLTLRREPFNSVPLDERLEHALSHPGGGEEWRAVRDRDLPVEFRRGDGGMSTFGDPIAGYCLGRAATRAALRHPAGSRGLADAYSLAPRGWHSFSWEGADDELATGLADAPMAVAEVDAEASRLGDDPGQAADFVDRARTMAAIARASEPISLEACAHWLVRDLSIDGAFMRVVQVIASHNPAHGGPLLARMANPALVAAAMRGDLLDFSALAELLPHLPATFAAGGQLGHTAAWMLLLEAEDRLLRTLHPQVFGAAPPIGAVEAEERRRQATRDVDAMCVGLEARADGPRLAAEWLAHLLWPIIQEHVIGNRNPGGVPIREILFSIASELFRERGWTSPARLWSLFGGVAFPRDAASAAAPGDHPQTDLPAWRDNSGKGSRLMPLAVAAHQWDGAADTATWLASWTRSASRHLHGDPALHTLAREDPQRLAAILARPIACSPDAAAHFGACWQDAAPVRLRARFKDLIEGGDDIQACRAIIKLGLSTLARSGHVSGGDHSGTLALLADAVDELRYCLPTMGFGDESGLAGGLVSALAAAGLLDIELLSGLLRRYDGDDESLAAAVASSLANGMAAVEVREALCAMGDDGDGLVARWKSWNGHRTVDAGGKPTPMRVWLEKL